MNYSLALLHPKTAKMRLAFRLVADFHGEPAARSAEEEFGRRFSGATGAVTAETVLLPDPPPENLAALLALVGLAPSRNLARQKIREGAVAVSDDGVSWRKVESPAEAVTFGPDGTRLLRLGKRFLRVARS